MTRDIGPRILVVGGSGFIGRHVVRAASARGWRVTNLSHKPVRPASPGGVREVVADIADASSLRRQLAGEGYEYVVNCAGHIDHALFGIGGRRVYDAHLAGVVNLVETLDRGALLRFINLGSSDEYGAAAAPQRETQREAPISPYSAAKTAATHFLQMLHRSERFPSTTLRLFLTYGPEQGPERFLPQVIRGGLEDRPFPASSGGQLRDFCYVSDIVRAIFASIDRSESDGEVINVGSGQPVEIRSVVELVCRLTGGGLPRFGEIAYRANENMELYPDITKARALLDWSPEVTLEEGVSRTIDWFRGASR